MSEGKTLQAIEQALATAAERPNATSATIIEWLNARKHYLDQEAQERKQKFEQEEQESRQKFEQETQERKQKFEQEMQRSRAKFWRWALSVCFILLFALILVWIFCPVPRDKPAAAPSSNTGALK